MVDDREPDGIEEIDLDRELEAELSTGEPASVLPVWTRENKVVVYGREFEIGEPNIGIVLRILNCLGMLGVRGERSVLRALQSLSRGTKGGIEVSWRASVFGMLASLNMTDLYSLGSAVLQFDDGREGLKFLKDAPQGHRLKLSPIVRAFWLNVAQSEDLKDSLNDFFVGLKMTGGLLSELERLGQ